MLISASMVLTPTLIYFFRTNFVFLSPSERGLGTKKIVELTMFLKYHYPTNHIFQVLVLLKRKKKMA